MNLSNKFLFLDFSSSFTRSLAAGLVGFLFGVLVGLGVTCIGRMSSQKSGIGNRCMASRSYFEKYCARIHSLAGLLLSRRFFISSSTTDDVTKRELQGPS